MWYLMKMRGVIGGRRKRGNMPLSCINIEIMTAEQGKVINRKLTRLIYPNTVSIMVGLKSRYSWLSINT